MWHTGQQSAIELPKLPPEAEELVEQMEKKQVLGASRHVKMILDVLSLMAEKSTVHIGRDLVCDLMQAADYFLETRGQETAAIVNGIRWVTDGLQDLEGASVDEVRTFVIDRCRRFIEWSKRAVEQLAFYGSNLLIDGQCVMVYDYSSSVSAILKQAANDRKMLTVIAPESRTVSGGRLVVEDALRWGHSVHFIADAAIGYFVRQANTVLIGVDTMFADGSFTNTVGTFMTAAMAKLYSVPVYAATELIKMDPSSIRGIYREIGCRELTPIFDCSQDSAMPGKVCTLSPDAELTPACYLTAYITEVGVIPPEVVWLHACDVLKWTNELSTT